MNTEVKELSLQELNDIYEKADQVDKRIFAEMRSNILLVSGEHYKKTTGQKIERSLTGVNMPTDRRLRLTKNHTQKITSDIKDIFISQVSSFKPVPRNESENSDAKAAEMTSSVWDWRAEKNNWADSVDRFVNSFVDIGEVASKVFFDPNQGDIKGYSQKVDEQGQPLFYDQMGQVTHERSTIERDLNGVPVTETPHRMVGDMQKPIFKGKTIIEKLYAFNLLRSPSAQTMKESPYVIYRHMKALTEAKSLAKDDETKEKIVESANRTYKVFDSTNGEFYDAKNQVMLKEIYYRPCQDYPRGYYYVWTDTVVIDKGEIPFGDQGEIAFPIKHAGYDIIETSPRYSSPIRPLRPIQGEVNRMASAQSETQITLGPDKVILRTGGTFSKGVELAGMRSFHASGPPPIVIPGRSGEQYASSLDAAINEMYTVGRVPENVSSSAQVTDPKAELFKSVRQKARFTRQQARLERFFQENIRTCLFLDQKHMPDDEVIRAAGRKEAVNIAEFKQVSHLDYAIKIEPVSGDYNTMFGKSLEIEMVGQYFGTDMPMDVKAALIKSLPYLNKEPALKNILLEYEAPQNMLLALDRGEEHRPNRYADGKLMLKHLFNRVQQADFTLLDPQIQANYGAVISQYEEVEALKAEEALRVTKGLIPTSGNLVKVDYYIMDEETGKQTRGTFPGDALEWLKTAIEAQGLAQQRLEEMQNQQGALEVGGMISPDAYPINPIPMEGMNNGY